MRSPIPTLVVLGPLPLYYHEGGRGGELCSNPSFPKRVSASGISANRLREVVICPERASVRAHTFLPHHHQHPRPGGEGGGGGGRPPTTQQPANKKKKKKRRRTTTPPTTTTWLPLLALSFFLLGFEATSFAAFVTKNTKPDSVACCFKM